MKIETREIYKCEFCNKLYQIKKPAEQHEKICKKNPDNFRPCLDFCQHLKKKQHSIYMDHFDGSESEIVKTFLYCDKLKVFLYPPKVEHKNNAEDLGDEENNPMPRQCEHYLNLCETVEVL